MKQPRKSQMGLRIAAGVAVVFGLLTVVSGCRALFGGPEASAAVGNAVPFVLWFNTLAGFAYVAAGIGLLTRRRGAVWLQRQSSSRHLSFLHPSVCTFSGAVTMRRAPSAR